MQKQAREIKPKATLSNQIKTSPIKSSQMPLNKLQTKLYSSPQITSPNLHQILLSFKV